MHSPWNHSLKLDTWHHRGCNTMISNYDFIQWNHPIKSSYDFMKYDISTSFRAKGLNALRLLLQSNYISFSCQSVWLLYMYGCSMFKNLQLCLFFNTENPIPIPASWGNGKEMVLRKPVYIKRNWQRPRRSWSKWWATPRLYIGATMTIASWNLGKHTWK